MKKIKLIFHGFGRIGRSIFRKVASNKKFPIVGINEINKLIEKKSKNQKFKIFSINAEPKVSLDYLDNEHSFIYDKPWSSKSGELFHSVL